MQHLEEVLAWNTVSLEYHRARLAAYGAMRPERMTWQQQEDLRKDRDCRIPQITREIRWQERVVREQRQREGSGRAPEKQQQQQQSPEDPSPTDWQSDRNGGSPQ